MIDAFGLTQTWSQFCLTCKWPHTFHPRLSWLYRCSRFQSEIKRLKISSPVRVCQNCYYNLQHELGTEGRNWALQNILQSSLMSDNHMYSIGFITTGIKKRRGVNENSFTAFSTCAHLPGLKKERNENHWSGTFQSITCHCKTLKTCLYCKYRPWPF